MIDVKALRIGNWILCKGSSHYGIVTGEILAKMEKDEKFREKFEYIELTGELLQAAGFFINEDNPLKPVCEEWSLKIGVRGDNENVITVNIGNNEKVETFGAYTVNDRWGSNNFKYLHELQNLIFVLTGSELPLPESAKRIPETINY